jgi:hypothetical protein
MVIFVKTLNKLIRVGVGGLILNLGVDFFCVGKFFFLEIIVKYFVEKIEIL